MFAILNILTILSILCNHIKPFQCLFASVSSHFPAKNNRRNLLVAEAWFWRMSALRFSRPLAQGLGHAICWMFIWFLLCNLATSYCHHEIYLSQDSGAWCGASPIFRLENSQAASVGHAARESLACLALEHWMLLAWLALDYDELSRALDPYQFSFEEAT